MKCFIMNPSDGAARISRFTSVEVEFSEEIAREFQLKKNRAGKSRFPDLNARTHTPLVLSESLRARLEGGRGPVGRPSRRN